MKLNDKGIGTSRTLIIIAAIIAVALVAALVVMLVNSKKQTGEIASDSGTGEAVATVPVKDTESATEPETTSEPEPELPPVEYDHADNIKLTYTAGETAPEFVNPLTGLALDSDIAGNRPAAIMINNIRVSCPQEGVGRADVLYELLAEGGITRLLMVVQDYSSLDVVGSVRSSRKYFIDTAQNHDAIYVHAGGSEEAYSELSKRHIDHIDGVRGGLSNVCFYRDAWRRANMGYEHSLMTTGELIDEGVARGGFRTELKSDYRYPFEVVATGYTVDLEGEDGKYVKITYRAADYPEYEYNEETGEYLRYQFQHEKHIDNSTGEQLSFKNVIVLVMRHTNTGDDKSHINIQTTGSGNGYYFTNGKYIPINWSCVSDDEPMLLTDSDGNRLLLNIGKTAVNVISPAIEESMVIN